MDPDANLADQEWTLQELEKVQDLTFGREEANHLRDELSDLRADLTDWLAGGGFAPDWAKAPRAAKYFGH